MSKTYKLGDYGVKGRGNQTILAKNMARWCQDHQCDFVVTLGDNFYKKGVKSVHDDHFKKSFLDVYQIDGLRGLKWYTIFGNHDYRGNPEAQIEYSQKSDLWYFPSPYYTHDHHKKDVSVRFFMLDTNPMLEDYFQHPKMNVSALKGQDVSLQLAWLRNVMKATDGTKMWKLVIGHHPLYTNRFKSPTMVEKLFPVVTECGAHSYFNGHDHNLQLFEENIPYITSGTGCSVKPVINHKRQTFVMEEMHFLYTTLQKDVMTIQVVGLEGQIYRTMKYGRNGPIKDL